MPWVWNSRRMTLPTGGPFKGDRVRHSPRNKGFRALASFPIPAKDEMEKMLEDFIRRRKAMIKVGCPLPAPIWGRFDTMGVALNMYNHFYIQEAEELSITGCPKEGQ